MKDKRLKFIQIAALLLISKGIKFTFNGANYLNSPGKFDLSFDYSNSDKVWVEQSGERWTEFTDPRSFKSFIENII